MPTAREGRLLAARTSLKGQPGARAVREQEPSGAVSSGRSPGRLSARLIGRQGRRPGWKTRGEAGGERRALSAGGGVQTTSPQLHIRGPGGAGPVPLVPPGAPVCVRGPHCRRVLRAGLVPSIALGPQGDLGA